MVLPMSCTSPCTVPMTTVPFFSAVALGQGRVADLGRAGHGVGREHELGQEHLAALEQVAHLGDAGDEARA